MLSLYFANNFHPAVFTLPSHQPVNSHIEVCCYSAWEQRQSPKERHKVRQLSLPDEVVNDVSGMDVDSDEGREGAAVQVGQGPPDQAGEGPQLGRACQHVLSQGSRRAGCAQALLYTSTPVHLHCYCL